MKLHPYFITVHKVRVKTLKLFKNFFSKHLEENTRVNLLDHGLTVVSQIIHQKRKPEGWTSLKFGICCASEKGQVWWQIPRISEPGRQRQKDLCKFQASLSYIVKSRKLGQMKGPLSCILHLFPECLTDLKFPSSQAC